MFKSRSKAEYLGNNKTLIFGVVAGGLLGAGAALLMSSKNCKDICRCVCKTCQNLTEKATELRENFFPEEEEGFKEKLYRWTDLTHDSSCCSNALIGSIALGVLGAAALYFFSPKLSKGTQFQDNAEYWISKINTILEKISESGEGGYDILGKKMASKINRAMDLANLGFKLFNVIKQRR